MAKRLSSSLVMIRVWGMLLLSPVRKNNVVASLVEDAPFRVTLSLSSRTVYRPELASRNPKIVTAVPGDSSARVQLE